MGKNEQKSSSTANVAASHYVEFAVVWLFVRILSALPRETALWLGAAIGKFAYRAFHRLRDAGLRNLEIAFPEQDEARRRVTLERVYRNLGHQLAEFCQMPSYTSEVSKSFIRYGGLDNYLMAQQKGKGVLVLTGHLGAWELSSFHHSLMGFPMSLVIRRLDNPLVDDLVNRIRCLHGNTVIHKDEFARGLLNSMHAGETVGILMDTNMTPPQGVFVPFFGRMAATASGLARVALKTGAAVIPGFLLWEESERRYVLHFGSQIELTETGDAEADAIANTAKFTSVIESYIRRYPDQWLWMHRRWKTRPPGEEGIY